MLTSPSEDFRLGALWAQLSGELVAAGDPGYEEARKVVLQGVDRRPRAVVRVADAGDVARVVSATRRAGVELAVRSGGHSFAGHGTSEGGIVIDLSEMKRLEIDEAGRTAWVQPGMTAGRVHRRHGRARSRHQCQPLVDRPAR